MGPIKVLAVVVFLLYCSGWAEECSANSGDENCNCESINSSAGKKAAMAELIKQAHGKLDSDGDVIDDGCVSESLLSDALGSDTKTWYFYDADYEYENGSLVKKEFQGCKWDKASVHHFISPDISDNQSSTIAVDVKGREAITFDWIVSSEAWWDFLKFYIGDSLVEQISGEVSERKSYSLPSTGINTLKWVYYKDGSVTRGGDAGYVSFMREIESKSSYGRYTSQQWSHYENKVMKSPLITHNQSVSMETIIEGQKHVSFRWKVSSEGYYDFLRLYVNGNLHKQISGDVDWENVYIEKLPNSGENTLRFEYFKDGSVSSREDAGWVDDLVVSEPITPPRKTDNSTVGDILSPNLLSN